MKSERIASTDEWQSLPELEVPELKSEEDEGLILDVGKIDYYLASKEECVAMGMKAEEIRGVVYALAVIYLGTGNELTLKRVPLDLTGWALQALSMAQKGAIPFPMRVEFKSVDGKKFAKVL